MKVAPVMVKWGRRKSKTDKQSQAFPYHYFPQKYVLIVSISVKWDYILNLYTRSPKLNFITKSHHTHKTITNI